MEQKYIIALIIGCAILVLAIVFIGSYLSSGTYLGWFDSLMGTAKASAN